MMRKRVSKKLVVAFAIMLALVLVIAIFALADPKSSTEPSFSNETSKKEVAEITKESNVVNTPEVAEPTESTAKPLIDPAALAIATIEPMSLSVSYLIGVGGFDFEVLRTSSGTQYIQFSSSRLTGTKCTDDKGQFASIIENPSDDESATLAKTTVVDATTYGLSLADETCTSDSGLLKQYQNAFSEPFGLLKKM